MSIIIYDENIYGQAQEENKRKKKDEKEKKEGGGGLLVTNTTDQLFDISKMHWHLLRY